MTKKEIISNVLNEKTPYRDKLNIPSNIGFGFEVESGLEFDSKVELSNYFKNLNWDLSSECSIYSSNGLEFSSPVFYNDKITWDKLKIISDKLSNYKADFSESSFQVNIDNILDKESFIIFIKLVTAYEDVIYSFSRGTDYYLRDVINYFADSIGYIVYNTIYDNKDYYNSNLLKRLSNNKKYTISVKDDHIVEFRTPNSTFNAILWQNYVNTFVNLMMVCKDKKIDNDKVDFYISKFKNPYYQSYIADELYLDKAIEFSNTIFTDDIDKLYFMKQYLSTLPKDDIKKLIK